MDKLLLEIKKEIAEVSFDIKKSNPDFSTRDIIKFIALTYFKEENDLIENGSLEKATKHQIGDIVKWGDRFWRKLSDTKWVKLPKKISSKDKGGKDKKQSSSSKVKTKDTSSGPKTKFRVAQEKA